MIIMGRQAISVKFASLWQKRHCSGSLLSRQARYRLQAVAKRKARHCLQAVAKRNDCSLMKVSWPGMWSQHAAMTCLKSSSHAAIC